MIPVFKPLLEEEEYNACQQVLDIGWLGQGKNVGQFEENLHKLIGGDSNKHVVALSTGHAALHLGLLIAGVGPGDEVITPSFNNIADFQAILATGADIVFCDIHKDTLSIDIDKAAELVTEKTKAIIVTDYGCILCDHDKINNFAKENNLRVIHDAAHSIGSKYKGQMVGSFSDICMFSFDPVKTFTCLDGGALVVNTKKEADLLREMRLVGMGQPSKVMYQNKRAWTYDVQLLGFRYHMGNMHAAIGNVQLNKYEKISMSRLRACKQYSEQLKSLEHIITPRTNFDEITPFLYYIRVLDKNRKSLMDHLAKINIDVGVHWEPGHWFSLFKNCRRGDLSITDQIGEEIMTLPLHSMMNIETVDEIVDGIENYFISVKK